MERIEGGRVRIVGQVLRTNSNRQRDYFGEQKAQIQTEYELSKYFSSSFGETGFPLLRKLFLLIVLFLKRQSRNGDAKKKILCLILRGTGLITESLLSRIL